MPQTKRLELDAPISADSTLIVPGVLHVYVSFDWGENVDLTAAQRLVPAELHTLPRRRRTPTSVAYRSPPLRLPLPPIEIELTELGTVAASADVRLFDFGAVSVGLEVPFRLSSGALRSVAGHLAEPVDLVRRARAVLEPLYEKLLPAIQDPQWSSLSEEYFVFEFPSSGELPSPEELLRDHAQWLAGLLRLEAGALSDEEVAEALRLRLSYSPSDLLVLEWSAAVLIDRDCDETLETIEFTNLQLLELRYIDNRLDDRLADAYRLIHPMARSSLPFWRTPTRSLRALGDLKIDANELFDRTGNVLKLVGDQYLARVYRMLATRFHLDDWAKSITSSLEVVESVYQVVAEQATHNRTELLEVTIIALIVFEILMAFLGH